MDAYEALITRRSPLELGEPAPDENAVRKLLAAAMRAPDHGRLRPWRFILIRGTAREKLGEVLASSFQRRMPDAGSELVDRERRKALRAPLIIVVAARIEKNPKVPEIEQILSAGAAAQNIILASHALGFGATWKTGEPAYDQAVIEALGLLPADKIVGFLYVGTPKAVPSAPLPQLDPSDFIASWS